MMEVMEVVTVEVTVEVTEDIVMVVMVVMVGGDITMEAGVDIIMEAGVIIMEVGEVAAEVVLLVGWVITMEDIMVVITEDTRTTMELDTAVKDTKPFLTIVAKLIPIITTIVRVDMVHNNSRRTMDENNYF